MVPDDTSRFMREEPVVRAARTEMLGLNGDDVRMCAGFPTRTATTSDGGQIWSYERAKPRGNINLVMPTGAAGLFPSVGGSANLAPGGYCNAQIRFEDGKVVKIAYAGDNNQPSSVNALCSSIVDGCVVYARDSRGQGVGAGQ
ncbi:hypothetical protein [Oryzicola mucosus]|uniref:hypothetical protein n=1 Tax=Oryzicola mucosus TaxID=2767425 RepID=UPI002EDA3F81